LIYILGSTLNTVGGSIRFILDLIFILQEKGFEVATILTQKTNWNFVKKFLSPPTAPPNKEYFIIPFDLPFFGLYQRLFAEEFLKLIKKKLSKDDVVIGSLGTFTPTIVDINYVHGVTSGHILSQYKHSLRRIYYHPYRMATAKTEDYLRHQCEIKTIANSEYTKQKLGKIGIKNVKVIYPPICAPVYFMGLNCERKNQVVMVSRATAGKGLDDFVEASQRLPDVSFVLICFALPAEYGKIRELIKEAPKNLSVKWNLSVIDRLKLIWESKVFLSLARGEHFGSTVLESAVAGCTPIIYPEGGVLEILNDVNHFKATTCDEAVRQIERAINSWDLEMAKRRSYNLSLKFGFYRFSEEIIPEIEQCRRAG